MSENELILIPKMQKYMQYIIEIILKMPRTEKFNIGTEYKTIMYKMLENIMYVNKLNIDKRLEYLNKIDAQINTQRVFLRIMYKYAWINEKKFDVAIDMLGEIGKILRRINKSICQKL